jgi:phage baseplate assembly protein gpV
MFLLLVACTLAPSEPEPNDIVPSLADDDTDNPWGDTDGIDDPDDTDTVDDTDAPLPDEEEPPRLLLNEVMPKNGFSLNVDGAYPDWIELYNASPEAVALDSVAISDGSGRTWMGIEGEILPGKWYLVYADEGDGAQHAPFTLDGNGDEITVSVDGWVTDRIATGELDADVSWARFPDGGAWAPTIWTTAGDSNGSVPSDTLDTNSTMFGLFGVHTVNVELSTAAVSSLRSSYATYVEGDITNDGSEMESVGVRLRGSSTLRTVDQKCSFKIDFDRYEDQRYRGLKKNTARLSTLFALSNVCRRPRAPA